MQRGRPGLTSELQRELGDLTGQLIACRDRLDRLSLHAAAADANQAVERIQSFIREAHPPG